MQTNQERLSASLHAGFVDMTQPAYQPFLPNLIVNNQVEGKKVLTTILHELNDCEEFWISVAFVTTSGVAALMQTLIDLEFKGVHGKILVSQYLNFTHPEALKRLLQFKNIELKIAVEGDMHSKGYLFKKGDHYNLIIGSSNLTASALSTNVEWNLKVTATPQSHIIANSIQVFSAEFSKAKLVNDTYINSYKTIYEQQRIYANQIQEEIQHSKQQPIVPNAMQTEALRNLEALRAQGKKKALLISATGTGKTFLSAFDVKKFSPKRFLFLVHRRNIAETAMKAYQKIFGSEVSMGVYSGDRRELHADFIFSTVQTISKETHLQQFDPSHFDYIVIDESHRSGADSYQRIIQYFTPKFLLGMTATPERTDGADIFQLFDYNIAFEIRLHQALAEDILSPFHYYGIADITVDNQLLTEDAKFSDLTSDERIDRIFEKAHLYGTDNGNIKGLIFCSSVQESKTLSRGMNERGLKTVALSGDDSEAAREKAIRELEEDEIDYILTVDIFNEGIDIPRVNQIIMLRPTQSAIVFVQQLGRGLRKIQHKDYLTVIDFIGNYKNNFMVPIALYGDSSYNKDTLRKLMVSGSSFIPGTSTINFDLISKNKIFEAISSTNMQLSRDLRRDYDLLKYRLGRVPMMMDFQQQGSRDPQLYVKYAKSYYNYVSNLEDSFRSFLNEKEKKVLELFSCEINNSKRVEESLILHHLLISGKVSVSDLKKEINAVYGYELKTQTLLSAIDNLNFKFVTEKNKGKLLPVHDIYQLDLVDLINGVIEPMDLMNQYLKNDTFHQFLLDSTNHAIESYRKNYSLDKYHDGFMLYQKYSRKDVFRILNWKTNPNAIIVGGYIISPDKSNCAIFVNYDKEDHISESTKYEDGFLNHLQFEWMSKSKRTLKSPDVIAIQNYQTGLRLPLFIKKSNDEGDEFYYMGEMKPIDESFEETTIPNNRGGRDSIVKVLFNLTPSVEPSLYNYLTTQEDEPIIVKASEQHHSSIATKLAQNKSKPMFKVIDFEQVMPYVNAIPLVRAAAGSYIQFEDASELTWVEPPTPLNKSNRYFICEVIGESMNKVIPNGSFCLFKHYTGGSREGEIAFVESRQIQDQEFGSHYTIKEYHSKKTTVGELWQHESITLSPLSNDEQFKPIELSIDNGVSLKVIGIFQNIIQ
jgi:superfamily II DNA or RNA helicase/HKD family nuclease